PSRRRSASSSRMFPRLHLSSSNSANSDGESSLRLTGCLAHIHNRKSTRLNSSHLVISYAVFCLKKKKKKKINNPHHYKNRNPIIASGIYLLYTIDILFRFTLQTLWQISI